MDQIKELRIDIFLLFCLVFAQPSPVLLGVYTMFFFLRLWWPKILEQLDYEIDDDEVKPPRVPTFSEVDIDVRPLPVTFQFAEANDLPAQDVDKLD